MTVMTTTTIPAWTVGDRLRKAREHAGIGSGEMAERLGVSRQTVGNWEAERNKPLMPSLQRWAEECGVPLKWILEGDEHGERRERVEPIRGPERRRQPSRRRTTRENPMTPWSPRRGGQMVQVVHGWMEAA